MPRCNKGSPAQGQNWKVKDSRSFHEREIYAAEISINRIIQRSRLRPSTELSLNNCAVLDSTKDKFPTD
jgi:hypothetical protein